MKVEKVTTRRILNSAGNLSLEVEVHSRDKEAYASVPAGKSTGEKEVITYPKSSIKEGIKELKKHKEDIKSDYYKFEDILKIEGRLPKAERIGGNTILAIEYALLRLLAKTKDMPIYKLLNSSPSSLPKPIANVIGGGSHAFEEGPTFQEFLAISKYESVKKNVLQNAKIYNKLREVFDIYGRDYENAFCVRENNKEVMQMFSQLKMDKIDIGIDMAASEFYKDRIYDVGEKEMAKSRYFEYVKEIIEKYDPFFIEDPFEEEDMMSFKKLNKGFPNKLICGDDLTVTNPKIIKKAAEKDAISAVIIKPNQIGSLLKMEKAIRIAYKNKIVPVISHRSEETNDPMIAHLAIGFQDRKSVV